MKMPFAARDLSGDLIGYGELPKWDSHMGIWTASGEDWGFYLRGSLFPEIKPGECRELITKPITDPHNEHGNGD